jgi:hypothetical protein
MSAVVYVDELCVWEDAYSPSWPNRLIVIVCSDAGVTRNVQVGATLIGVHYYLNAWHPAMMEEPPLLGFKYYAFYMYCFFM